MGAYYTERELWFSALYGGAVYRKTGETGERPVSGSDKDAGKKKDSGKAARPEGTGVSRGNASGISILSHAGTGPVLTNLITGEQVYLLRLPDGTDRRTVSPAVLSPPSPDLGLWPVDLIPLSPEQWAQCTLWAEHIYVPEYAAGTESGDGADAVSGTGEQASGVSPAGGVLAAAFPLDRFRSLRDGQSVLDNAGPLNWKNPAARSLALRLAESVERLNRDGWLYFDFHPSRLFFRENGRVCLDYTCLAVPAGQEAALYRPAAYPVEFADPAVVRGLVSRPDTRSQNYSLCALLFYVLFGRLPCDGALLAGYPDDDTHNHFIKFRDYHKMPIFLFDPDDGQNAPGAFAEDEELSALWRECPEDLRKLFTQALCRKSAERQGGYVPEAPEILERLRRALWGRPGKRR